jgi:hypothetical protein
MDKVRGVRRASVSVAQKVLEYHPQPSMWVASGVAIAHAPDIEELRDSLTGGANIQFDAHGHSSRHEYPERMRRHFWELRRSAVGPIEDLQVRESKAIPLVEQESLEQVPKDTWTVTARHGVTAFWKFFITPTGLLITLYGLNVIAWGAMLFFLFLKAAPDMNHPDNGNAKSSPRKIWIEIDSQILNALFCLPAWGLAPWRFRDMYWTIEWRMSRDSLKAQRAFDQLKARNEAWFRAQDDEATVTATGNQAPPTSTWKLDFVVWMMVLNSLLQVGMAFFMWHWDRLSRPSWGAGTFIGLGCAVSILAGVVTWWEGRKVKKIEGPKIRAHVEPGEA